MTVYKLLVMWFEERMTWRFHIGYEVEKCTEVINFKRCLAVTADDISEHDEK